MEITFTFADSEVLLPKKRAAKIGRNIKKNTAVEIPEHFISAFKPAKEFLQEVKSKLQSE